VDFSWSGRRRPPLAEEAPSLPEPAAATSSAGRLTVGETSLAVGGFLQADGILMDQSSEGQLFPSGGEPLNTQRFLIRRARLSAEAHRGALGAVVELDANTMKGMAVGWPGPSSRWAGRGLGGIGSLALVFSAFHLVLRFRNGILTGSFWSAVVSAGRSFLAPLTWVRAHRFTGASFARNWPR